MTVCGDGEYIIYTALAWRNRSFGSALEFVWSTDGEYAVRESTSKIKIFNKSFQVQQRRIFPLSLVAQAFLGYCGCPGIPPTMMNMWKGLLFRVLKCVFPPRRRGKAFARPSLPRESLVELYWRYDPMSSFAFTIGQNAALCDELTSMLR